MSRHLCQRATIFVSCPQIYIEFHCGDAARPALDGGYLGDRSAADFFTACPSDSVRIDFLAAFFSSME
jgi:hypothetical protein